MRKCLIRRRIRKRYRFSRCVLRLCLSRSASADTGRGQRVARHDPKPFSSGRKYVWRGSRARDARKSDDQCLALILSGLKTERGGRARPEGEYAAVCAATEFQSKNSIAPLGGDAEQYAGGAG